jgi:hypothetical protein
MDDSELIMNEIYSERRTTTRDIVEAFIAVAAVAAVVAALFWLASITG